MTGSVIQTRPGTAAPDTDELGGQAKVLLVDENPIFRRPVASALRSIMGLQVLEAGSDEEARRQFESETAIRVIVVATNVNGGLELVQYFRQNFPLPKPIVALGNERGGRQMLLQAGCNQAAAYRGIATIVERLL